MAGIWRGRTGGLLIAALCAGASYWPAAHLLPHAPEALIIAWKGLGVALLAAWVFAAVPGRDGRWLAAVLALGALGDVLLDAVSLTVGAVAFLAGHVLAVPFYWRHRSGRASRAAMVAVAALAAGVVALAASLPTDRAAAPGIAFYSSGLAAMAAMAALSRFRLAASGALLFVISDLLIFAGLGPLAGSPATLLVWPLYFAGQALIAVGAGRALVRCQAG
ncbi:lysoplasmalogenase [Sphingomonas changnyeongensis]|uniref:Lysoplasmalogenase n=2 Tax=Sphingomonas changnyeongensis TaxID=2698679 RepID=A0A7Z2S6V5_9SPHN|nr:lysoplasmalogenase [Sphingomonas changnyeongensis]